MSDGPLDDRIRTLLLRGHSLLMSGRPERLHVERRLEAARSPSG